MDKIIYLHGFHSSPYSAKALEFKKQAEQHYPNIEVIAPQLPPLPQDAIALINGLVLEHRDDLLGVVGSSMGGYLSTYLHNEFHLPCVVINPAVKAYNLMRYYLGEQTHPLLNQTYVLTDAHMVELKNIFAANIRKPEHCWLLQQEGDEVLNFQDALDYYQGCKITCEVAGSHAFEGFERYPTAIIEFLLASQSS